MKVLFSGYVFAKKTLLYKKCVHKMLMKLTPARENIFFQAKKIKFWT